MNKQTFFLLTLTTLTLFATAGGCGEESLRDVNDALGQARQLHADANGVLTKLEESPIGPFIPSQVRQIMEILGVGVTTAIAIWKTVVASGLLKQNSDLTVTLGAVVDGVERAGDKGRPVKAKILETMRDREVYSVANPIVDQVKTKNS